MDINIAPLRLSNNSLLNSVVRELSNSFLSHIRVVDINIGYKDAYNKERLQYFSTQILSNSINLTSEIKGKVIILTEIDLFVPALTYVFGEAQLSGKHSILSVCRLHEEFYGEPSNDLLLLQRTKKEVLHELGHNFGLKHCDDWNCVMHSSLGIEEVDIKGSNYCKKCSAVVEDYKYIL